MYTCRQRIELLHFFFFSLSLSFHIWQKKKKKATYRMCSLGKSTKYFGNNFACWSDATIFLYYYYFLLLLFCIIIFCIFRSPDIVNTIHENLMKNIALWFGVHDESQGHPLLTLRDKRCITNLTVLVNRYCGCKNYSIVRSLQFEKSVIVACNSIIFLLEMLLY